MDDDTSDPRLTRRKCLAGGSALFGSALLAGCAGGGDETPSDGTATEGSAGGEPAESATATPAPTDAPTATATDDGGYSATLSPVGEVTLDSEPESVFTMYNQFADMLVALGYGDTVNSMFVPEMAGPTMNHYYERLDGVSFDWEGLPNPFDDFSKEFFYGLESDVHLLDPAWATTQSNWSRDDVAEITDSVGPFFGNFYSGTHAAPPESYGEDYQYYTLWELFGRVAELFRERERYEQLAAVHSDLVATIEADLPPKEERPTAVRVTLGDGQFWTYHLNRPGFWLADTRPLAAVDAFDSEQWDGLWGSVGYETMIEADPDVILHLWGMTPRYDMANVREQLRSDDVGAELSAVQNDRVYAQGMRYQGPLMNLFQIEMTAKQLYPDVFGEWPGYEDGDHYPELPAEERLFDRERVAGIVTGN
ncbi:ABC transporter substrate-binding protein [Halosimplex pelagicum]|uniref:ABC transporter substrate-binding protein n=1 Tax=Halosimplex pelagicum TaxID=869886 RepID=A0A7D5PC48_9EURY|nr:ABC transporter substrate-binding protein [Halosimplex pelagicum]QLH84741.1 ABC transporter substrate-binding protein [Halosimplex pelagicum]